MSVWTNEVSQPDQLVSAQRIIIIFVFASMNSARLVKSGSWSLRRLIILAFCLSEVISYVLIVWARLRTQRGIPFCHNQTHLWKIFDCASQNMVVSVTPCYIAKRSGSDWVLLLAAQCENSLHSGKSDQSMDKKFVNSKPTLLDVYQLSHNDHIIWLHPLLHTMM